MNTTSKSIKSTKSIKAQEYSDAYSNKHLPTEKKIGFLNKNYQLGTAIHDNKYGIKLEENKQKDMANTYHNKMSKVIETEAEVEAEIEQTIQELNEKETMIYNYQRANLDKFKVELKKYEDICFEFQDKINQLQEKIKQDEELDEKMQEVMDMIMEDYYSTQRQLTEIREKAAKIVEELKAYQEKNPEEFQYLQEDFQLHSDLEKARNKKEDNGAKIEEVSKEIEEEELKLKDLELELTMLEKSLDEKRKLAKSAESLTESNLENLITKYVKDVHLWDILKSCLDEYYTEMLFDGGTKTYLTNLREQWENNMYIAKSKLNLVNKDLEMQIATIQERVNELKEQGKDASEDEEQLEDLNNQLINSEEVYGNVIAFYQCFLDSALTGDPSDFDKNWIQKTTEINKQMDFLNEKAKNSYIKAVQVYLDNFKTNLSDNKTVKFQDRELAKQVRAKEKEVMTQKEKVDELKKNKTKLEEESTNATQEIETISDTIVTRNKSLKIKLENKSHDELKNYKKENEKTLKNMNKMYGQKMVKKVSKIQQEKIYENIVQDYKENNDKIMENIEFLTQCERMLTDTHEDAKKLKIEYNDIIFERENLAEEKQKKIENKELLEKSKKELEEKILQILEKQTQDSIKEKQALFKKYNMHYFKEKLKILQEKLKSMDKQKTKLNENLNKFKEESTLKGNEMEIKNVGLNDDVIALKLRITDEPDPVYVKKEEVVKEVRKKREVAEDPNLENDKNLLQSTGAFGNGLNNKAVPTDPDEIIFTKITPLLDGIYLYKKFLNTKFNPTAKKNDPFALDEKNPEKIGYASRIYKLIPEEFCIGVYTEKNLQKGYRPENTIKYNELNSVMIPLEIKKVLKKRDQEEKKKTEADLLAPKQVIPFDLILKDQSISLIAVDYTNYAYFKNGVEELIANGPRIIDIINRFRKDEAPSHMDDNVSVRSKTSKADSYIIETKKRVKKNLKKKDLLPKKGDSSKNEKEIPLRPDTPKKEEEEAKEDNNGVIKEEEEFKTEEEKNN